MNLLFVASELAPYAKTGGLADVMAALPAYLHRQGHDVRIVIPFYDRIDTKRATFVAVGDIDIKLGKYLYRTKIFRVDGAPPVYLVHCPDLYARGSLYTSDSDEHRRFLVLQYAALILCQRWDWAPDVIHAHDWQASLLPMYVKTLWTRIRKMKP